MSDDRIIYPECRCGSGFAVGNCPCSTLRQAADGEFAPLRDEASTMTAGQFADKHGVSVRDWGKPPAYDAVRVGGVDYLWVKSTGDYDGYDVVLSEEEHND